MAIHVSYVDRRVKSIITLCKTVKELWEFLKFIFGKFDKLNCIYALLQEIFCPKQDKCKLMDYVLEFKKYNKELTSLLAWKFVEEMLTQQSKRITLSCLSGLIQSMRWFNPKFYPISKLITLLISLGYPVILYGSTPYYYWQWFL